jgi:hypothetical protein
VNSLLYGIREVLSSTIGQYVSVFLLVGLGMVCWAVIDARRQNNERALVVGVGLLALLHLVTAVAFAILIQSGVVMDTLLFVTLGVLALSVVALGAGYLVYSDAEARGEDGAPAWGIVVGLLLYSMPLIGVLTIVLYLSMRA